MIIQLSLMTCHKGVDLHAETAARVMRRRLEGGEALIGLHRAEVHTFWHAEGDPAPESVDRLLGVGRYFNPNKHHHAHFRRRCESVGWSTDASRGGDLPAGWPGDLVGTDLPGESVEAYDRLLGGVPADGAAAVDVCAFPLGEDAVVSSGIVWRLVFAPGTPGPAELAARLAEARGARDGLLVNPHMQGWLIARP